MTAPVSGWAAIALGAGWLALYLQNSLIGVLAAAALFGYLLSRED